MNEEEYGVMGDEGRRQRYQHLFRFGGEVGVTPP
jgi:hypothetical protein